MTREHAPTAPDLPVVGNSEPGDGETQPRRGSCYRGHWLYRPRNAAPEDPWACRLCPYTTPFLGRTL